MSHRVYGSFALLPLKLYVKFEWSIRVQKYSRKCEITNLVTQADHAHFVLWPSAVHYVQGRIKASRGPRPKYFAGPHVHTFIGTYGLKSGGRNEAPNAPRIETRQASRGWGIRRGSPSPADYGVWGSVVSSLSGVRAT